MAAGIKGLRKGDRPVLEQRAKSSISPAVEEEAKEFISGAVKRAQTGAAKPSAKQRVFERYTFSLTPDVSIDIDALTLVPPDFRVNRSEVIKAAIQMLKELPGEKIVKALRRVKSQ